MSMFVVPSTTVVIAVATLMLLGHEVLNNFIDFEHAKFIKKMNFSFLSEEIEDNQINLLNIFLLTFFIIILIFVW